MRAFQQMFKTVDDRSDLNLLWWRTYLNGFLAFYANEGYFDKTVPEERSSMMFEDPALVHDEERDSVEALTLFSSDVSEAPV